MSGINILLTEANGNLTGSKEMIERAVRRAEETVFPRLQIDWDIDLLVTDRLRNMVIPEDGVGGRTITSDFIEFAIDKMVATESKIAEMVAHELCHAARWGKNDEWANTLFDELISEGLAVCFEAEFADGVVEKTEFLQTMSARTDAENEAILNVLRERLDSNEYEYGVVFFDGDSELPRWAGYSLGYYLVKRYLAQAGKSITEAFADKYADFRVVL